MKYSPDAYLLHESNRFITFNIRIKVVMKDMVKPDALRKAAEKRFAVFLTIPNKFALMMTVVST